MGAMRPAKILVVALALAAVLTLGLNAPRTGGAASGEAQSALREREWRPEARPESPSRPESRPAPPDAPLAVRALNVDGDPIFGATIRLHPIAIDPRRGIVERDDPGVTSAATNAEGFATFDRLSAGRYVAVLAASRRPRDVFGNARRLIEVDPDQPQVVRLAVAPEHFVSVSGTLTGLAPGTPPLAPVFVDHSASGTLFAGTPDGDGYRASLIPDRPYLVALGPAEPGDVEGAPRALLARVVVGDEREQRLDLALPEGAIEGRFVDAEEVAAVRLIPALPPGFAALIARSGLLTAVPDRDGAFAFDHVEAGDWTLEAWGKTLGARRLEVTSDGVSTVALGSQDVGRWEPAD